MTTTQRRLTPLVGLLAALSLAAGPLAAQVEPETMLKIELVFPRTDTVVLGALEFDVGFRNTSATAFPLDDDIVYGASGNVGAKLVVQPPEGARFDTQIRPGNTACTFRSPPMLNPGASIRFGSTVAYRFQPSNEEKDYRWASVFSAPGQYGIKVRAWTRGGAKIESQPIAVIVASNPGLTADLVEQIQGLSDVRMLYERAAFVGWESGIGALEDLVRRHPRTIYAAYARLSLSGYYAALATSADSTPEHVVTLAVREGNVRRAAELLGEVHADSLGRPRALDAATAYVRQAEREVVAIRARSEGR